MGMLNRTRGTGVCPCRDCNGGEDYGYSKANRLREKREWLRELRDELPAQSDEGDMAQMLSEHEEWVDIRARANWQLSGKTG